MKAIDQPASLSTHRDPARDGSVTSRPRPVPRWLIALIIIGALLMAAGAVLALLPSADHLSAAGRHYADYFVTRNLALSLFLLVTLARRAWPVLAGLMILTALIQSFDAITALATGQFGLVPIDLAFVGLFLLGAARLAGHQVRPARREAA